MSLRVHRTVTNGNSKQLFCELPDGTIAGLPSWMMDPNCHQCSVGEPAIALDALRRLRDVLKVLQHPPKCDKALLTSLKEGTDGNTGQA
jgi:hypothetical protein